jgi:hypothetical protein
MQELIKIQNNVIDGLKLQQVQFDERLTKTEKELVNINQSNKKRNIG